MNRLECTRVITNQNSDENSNTIKEYDFDNEGAFLTWLETEKNRIGWFHHKTYPGVRKAKACSSQNSRYNTEWSRYYHCPFSSKRKLYIPRSNPRPNQKPSIKVGCKATLRAVKKFDDPRIRVYYNGNHLNHQPDSLDSWQRRRIAPVLRSWLKQVVAAGLNWEAFKILARPTQETLATLESGHLSSHGAIEIDEKVRVSRNDFNNYRRSYRKGIAQHDTDTWKSLEMHAANISEEGGLSFTKKICRRNSNCNDFIFAFCTSWQADLLRRYSSFLCLDSTHNTCCTLQSSRAAYLHSIVIKHDGAGCGVPVAFMITSTETMEPLEEWLRWLKDTVPFITTPIFMIDCSKTEVAAIKAVFPEPKIRYCYWHFFRALRSQGNSRISDPEERQTALKNFKALVWTKSRPQFNLNWENYLTKYEKYKEWISYLKVQWMNDIDKWWSGCRTVNKVCFYEDLVLTNLQGMLDIHTNNLVESWHNILKSRYLKGARKQRPDMLVQILLDEAIESIRLKVLLALNGFQTRRTNLAEQYQLEKSNSIPSEIAMTFVSHKYATEGSNESSEEIFVKSFTNENKKYKISLNDEGLVSSCTCEYMSTNFLVCKHMYLASRILGYIIQFDIRKPETSEFGPALISRPDLDGSDQETFAADFCQVIKLIEPVINDYDKLENQDQSLCQEVLETLRVMSNIRHRISRHNWSRKQRR